MAAVKPDVESGQASYEVIVPLVIAKASDGRDVYLYKGSPVPADIPSGEIDRLAAGEYIK